MTRHVSDLQADLKDVRSEVGHLRESLTGRLHGLELEINSLKGAQAAARETIRAEIATAVADLRLQYIDMEARRHRPPLAEGADQGGGAA